MSLHIKLLKYLSTINLFLVFIFVPIHLNSWVIFLNCEICARCGIFFPCVSNHLPWKAWCGHLWFGPLVPGKLPLHWSPTACFPW
jgi:hypothetical protein